MSECIGKNTEDQKKCKYYEKSNYKDSCMYYIFDQFCDCLAAQLDSNKSIEEKNQETIDELKNSEVGKTD